MVSWDRPIHPALSRLVNVRMSRTTMESIDASISRCSLATADTSNSDCMVDGDDLRMRARPDTTVPQTRLRRPL
jgi:hypothetical protein